MKFPRSSGVLLHPTSLPGRHGIDPELISPHPNAALVGPLDGCRSPLDSGFFIVTPEIVASLFFGWVMNHLLGNDRLTAVVAGGGFIPEEQKQRTEEKQDSKQLATGLAR
jgi:hypothetical protein